MKQREIKSSVLRRALVPAAGLLSILSAPAAWAGDATGKVAEAKQQPSGFFADIRYRDERVSQDALTGKVAPLAADASTVRAKLGYQSGTYHGIGARVSAQTLQTVGGGGYNSTTNGMTAYSTVPDPVTTQLDEAYLSYSGLDNTRFALGRQVVNLDNARFIGNVGWRQIEQTFNALTVVNTSLPDTRITAGEIVQVNRVFGDYSPHTSGPLAGKMKMHSPIVNVSYGGWQYAQLTGYGYFLNYDPETLFTANSTRTEGLRLKGSAPAGGVKLLYTAEYASQSNYGTNPASYHVGYNFVEAGVDAGLADFRAGREVLGADGRNHAFQTPLATLHAFNGWAEMFLTKPGQGLKDTYYAAGTKIAAARLDAIYHSFRADQPTAAIGNFGNEWDFQATRKFYRRYTLGATFADFRTQNATLYANTRRLWFWLAAAY